MHKSFILCPLLTLALNATADDNTGRHIILSGNDADTHSLPVATYNRIEFDGDNIILTSRDGSADSVRLLHSLYRRLHFSDRPISLADPTEMAATSIAYQPASRSLLITAEKPSAFLVGIFSPDGTLRHKGHPDASGQLLLAALQSGVHIAVATDGTTSLNLKFIIK